MKTNEFKKYFDAEVENISNVLNEIENPASLQVEEIDNIF